MAPTPSSPETQREAVVLVLGDVGRSPRMQYHALSLASLPGVYVTLVGTAGEPCCPPVEQCANITQVRLQTAAPKPSWLPFFFYGPFKVLRQLCQLLWVLLCGVPRPSWILLQNPPSIPTLFVAWLVCRVRGSKFIVDWHNFGYSLLALKLGSAHPFVAMSRMYERFLGGCADGSLCVTHAMQAWLLQHWGIRSNVLHDRPPPFFRRSSDAESHELFGRLREELPRFQSRYGEARSGGGPASRAVAASADLDAAATLFTTLAAAPPLAFGSGFGPRSGKKAAAAAGAGAARAAVKRPDRPALLVSSTSWTEDEDFGLLLTALVALDKVAVDEPDALPDFVVVVTGKGPLRAHYEERFSQLRLRRVHIRTLWLAAADYPVLLGAADAGVCLHTSSSGLDLPMKVVDMFGAGLPALAVDFSCLGELVRDGENGRVFRTASELARDLAALFRGFPGEPAASELARLSRGAAATVAPRWEDNWTQHARPLFV